MSINTITTDQGLTVSTGDWVRVARRNGGRGVDAARVVQFGEFGGAARAKVDGPAHISDWVPAHRITEIIH